MTSTAPTTTYAGRRSPTVHATEDGDATLCGLAVATGRRQAFPLPTRFTECLSCRKALGLNVPKAFGSLR